MDNHHTEQNDSALSDNLPENKTAEDTQPIKVGHTEPLQVTTPLPTASIPERDPLSDTAQVRVDMRTVTAEGEGMPDWLVAFAREPEKDQQEAADLEGTRQIQTSSSSLSDQETLHGVIAEAYKEDEAAFAPPPIDSAGWQAIDLNAPLESEDGSDSTFPEPIADSTVSNKIESLKALEPEAAADAIRENMADPEFAEAAKVSLRSRLTLEASDEPLWKVYNELMGNPQRDEEGN